MGMFSTKGYISESYIDIDSIPAQECFEENSMDSALRVMAENTANWNAIMESIGIEELAVYESTGSEIVYEEGTITNIFNKIKEFLKKLLEKIKGIFGKFMTVINSWAMKDKEFTRKYKADLLKADMKDFEFKGYKFTLEKLQTTSFSDGLRDSIKSKHLKNSFFDLEEIKKYGVDKKEDLDDLKKTLTDKKEDLLDVYRGGMIVGNTSDIDAEDFSKELFMAARNGDDQKDTLDEKDIDILVCIQQIDNTEKDKKDAKKVYDALNKGITDAIKEIDNYSKELIRDESFKDTTKQKENELKTSKIAVLSSAMSLYEGMKSINTIVFGAYIQAIKDRNRQCKAICVKALTRKQAKNESYFYNEGSSMLGSVHLI